MEEKIVKYLVGQKIKSLRHKYKLTQFALGEKIDINQRQIAQIECGNSFPSLSTLIKMSNVFGCGVATFFEKTPVYNEVFLKQMLKEKIDKFSYDDCLKLLNIIEIVGIE